MLDSAGVLWHHLLWYMVEQYIHLYEKLSLGTAGVCMGLALVLGHMVAAVYPQQTLRLAARACESSTAGKALLVLDFVWIALLLLDVPGNPLRMDLYDFSPARQFLLLACPVVCYIMCAHSGPNLFGRALGVFLLLLGIVPLSAAYLKEPETRILIPLWWYPVLACAIFWVPKPYLLRDWVAWLRLRPGLVRVLACAGAAYGAAVLICALLFWI